MPAMKNFKAIIWDMDGVLVESEKMHVEAEVKTLQAYGIDLPKVDTSHFMGMCLHEYFEKIGEHCGVELPIDELMEGHTKTLENYYGEYFPEVPNVRETLEKLAPDYAMALATSMQHNLAQIYLKRVDITQYFQFVIGGNDVTKAKPDPEIFLKSAKKLNLPSEQCVVIEDSTNGIHAGKAAGMFVIARRAEHNASQDLSQADHIIDDLLEIPVYLSG